jgi:predicted TPR repeat methyltransferase
MYKLTGVARSKGMVIQEFEKDLYAKITVGDREMFLPIHMIMNTQGKRKNKLAEFGLSTLRME